MTMQDPIADMFIRVKNAQAVAMKEVEMPSSKLKVSIAQLLKDEGYIKDFRETNQDGKKNLVVLLAYHQGKPVISTLKRLSRPGIRVYRSKKLLPKVLGGLGVAIISTSKGILSDRKARLLNEGGEVIGVVS